MATKKFSSAQIAAQKLFAERARAGTLSPKYNEAAVNKSIASSRSKISAGEGKTIKRLLMGRTGNPMTPRGFVIADNYTREIFNPYGAKPYDAIFMRTTREPGFSPYDLTILKSNSGEFIAATGSKVYQEKFTTAAAAANWLANWYKENKQKMYRGVKTNPDKEKPNVYIKRVSQATGASPTKRLVKRRTKALFAPAGYFPNPKAAMMTGYQVICMHPKKHVVGIFKTMAEAKLVARAMADAKGVAYGVKAVKVHKTHFAV